MTVLELEMPENKEIKVILVESEFTIEWEFDKANQALFPLSSEQYRQKIDELLGEYKPDFIAEELGSRNRRTVEHDGQLNELFREKNIPHFAVEMDDNAKAYLLMSSSMMNYLQDLETEINRMKKGGVHDGNHENLLMWYEFLRYQKKEFEMDIRKTVREAWFTMALLDRAGELDNEKITAFLILNRYHFSGMINLFNKLGIRHEEIKIEKKVKQGAIIDLKSMLVTPPDIEITFAKEMKKKEFTSILYFFDTDPVASPFDVNMAYDAGFDVVYPIPNARAANTKVLTGDLIFSRSPKGNDHTAILIGGKDIIEAEKIFKAVKESMFPPFQVPVIIDPRGAYTTAAAAMVKAMKAMNCFDMNCFRATAAVLGTGPVGVLTAVLLAESNCEVMLVETGPASAGFSLSTAEQAVKVCKMLNKDVKIIPAHAPDEETKKEVLAECEVIFSCGAAGHELISEKLINDLDCLLYLDSNATPPAGVHGLKASCDNKMINAGKGVAGIGALAIGDVKRQIETALLEKVKHNGSKILYTYHEIFALAVDLYIKSAQTTGRITTKL